MNEMLEKYLLEAAGIEKEGLSSDNPYKSLGFDENKKRLGWVNSVPFSEVKKSLEEICSLIEGKDIFVFVGMGGSINGIKPLISLFKKGSFYTLDNLDPEALSEIVKRKDNLEKTLVVSISKSGTTKETQLISLVLKELFSQTLGDDQWQNHFLWLSDNPSFEKLDTLGWQNVKKISIQLNNETDIGGRFSSPNTLIFLLPLFLLLGENFNELEDIYNYFISNQKNIRKNAYSICESLKDEPNAYFSPVTDGRLGESFSSWLVQLFQESLGSKNDTLPVKTLPNNKDDKGFFNVELDLKIDNAVVSLMSQMYFFQNFIAYYAVLKGINFVSQNFVEKYKQEMGKLESQSHREVMIKPLDLDGIINKVKEDIKPAHKFIEIVLYFYPTPEVVDIIERKFKEVFNQRKLLVFEGSDWNHQSYQAAFGDKDTFYVLLTLPSYSSEVPNISKEILTRNIDTIRLIAEATYFTIKDKAVLFSLLS